MQALGEKSARNHIINERGGGACENRRQCRHEKAVFIVAAAGI